MSWIAVAIGGALGASLRYAIALSFSASDNRFPLATFISNSLGCFLMGLGFVVIVERAMLPEIWRQLLLVGFLGAFTTFSTFSIEVLSLLKDEYYYLAAFYIFASVVLSLMFVALGVVLARNIF